MNRSLVITGASSDIGLAISKRVATPDDHVILHCNSNSAKLTGEMNRLGENCRVLSADFSKPECIDAFVEEIGVTDVLINCAGLTRTDLLVNLSDDDLTAMFNVNNLALMKVCKYVIPAMLAKRKGVIVTISSITAIRGNRGQTAYAGTKGFVEAFSRSLAAEYGAKGVRVNCVAPGPIDTGAIADLLGYAGDAVQQSTAVKRLGTPEDIAGMVHFLCSDDATFITGKTFGVDGGFMQGV